MPINSAKELAQTKMAIPSKLKVDMVRKGFTLGILEAKIYPTSEVQSRIRDPKATE